MSQQRAHAKKKEEIENVKCYGKVNLTKTEARGHLEESHRNVEQNKQLFVPNCGGGRRNRGRVSCCGFISSV